LSENEIKNFIKELERLQISQIYGPTIQTRDTVTSYIPYKAFRKVVRKYRIIFGVD